MTVEINCPRCNEPLEAALYQNAYCKKCDTTFEAVTEVFDMFTGECTYELTGKSSYGKDDSH